MVLDIQICFVSGKILICLLIKGDIVVGPFISHGIETENKEMLKTVNKKPSTSSEIIANWNVENYLERMHKRESAKSDISTNLTRRREKYRSHYMNGISVNFLSPTGFDELENSPWSNQLFDAIFLSTANAGKLQNKDFIQHCLKPNGFVLVESPTYILDLKPEQDNGLKYSIVQILKLKLFFMN